MRFGRFDLVLSFFLLNLPVCGQQAQPNTAPSPAPKDPQAVTVLNQALAVAGGATAIIAIADYTATGNIIYSGSPQVQGGVTVLAVGLNQCRLDANLPNGMRSWAVTEGRMTKKAEDGSVKPVHSQIPMNLSGLVVPYLELSIALNSPAFGLSNKGIIEVSGRPAYDIQVQRVAPGITLPTRLAGFSKREYFVDTSTFQVVMTQDLLPDHAFRQLQYSDFRPINGVLVPFSINEEAGGQQTWAMQLSQITFNSGLQDSNFALQ